MDNQEQWKKMYKLRADLDAIMDKYTDLFESLMRDCAPVLDRVKALEYIEDASADFDFRLDEPRMKMSITITRRD